MKASELRTKDNQHISVLNCSRCGEDHGMLLFQLLTNPFISEGDLMTHWSTCPKNGQPILLFFEDTED